VTDLESSLVLGFNLLLE